MGYRNKLLGAVAQTDYTGGLGLSLKRGTGNQGMGMGNGERGTGNGESLKWGIFKSGNL